MADGALTHADIVAMTASLRRLPSIPRDLPPAGLLGGIRVVTNPWLTEPVPERERLYRGRPICERKRRLRKKLNHLAPRERPMRGGYMVAGLGLVMHPEMVGVLSEVRHG